MRHLNETTPPLFAATHAKRDDPDTSVEAAAKAFESGSVGRQAARVLAALVCANGQTSAEIGVQLGTDRFVPARRLPDLERAGKVTRGIERPCTVSGSRCVTWWLV